MTTLTELSIREAGQFLRQGETKARDLTEACLERIQEVDGRTNAFITIMADSALLEAQQADAELASGTDRGPLHGIPVGLKDLCATKGVRTTAGSRILGDWVPDHDATVVTRLREAGAVAVGKLNMHEFAYGTDSANPWYGPVHNPWDLDRHPGGSSGGSGAAVAAGECFAATGTDTGGSIRIPAALCGIVGLMPTYGLVSRAGVVPLSWSLDHVGPLARTVEDSALFLNAVAGHDPADPGSIESKGFDATGSLGRSVKGIRVGVARSQFENCEPGIAKAVERGIDALKALGAIVTDIQIPMLDDGFRSIVLSVEAAAYHAAWLREQPGDYGQDVRTIMTWGFTVPAVEYVNALRMRREFTEEVAETMNKCDAVAMPTCERVATRISDVRPGSYRYSALTAPWNHTGQPVISVPCGFAEGKMPVGISLAGRPLEEALLCQVAYALETELRVEPARPPI
ncbi:MAG TPA: amidase [Dehalococcoidia bacterium]|nr:amidase [Dehalococcoidia bacterium]